MKATLVLLVVVLIDVMSVNAQIRLGLRGAVSQSNVTMNGTNRWQPLDWSGSVVTEIKVADVIWLQPEIGVASRHSFFYSEGQIHDYEIKYNLFQLETNLLCKYLLIEEKIKILPFAGLTTGYVISGQAISNGIFPSGAIVNNHVVDLGFNWLKQKRFIIGPIFGLAFQWPLHRGGILLDLRFSSYDLGTFPGSDFESRDNKFSAGVGYFLGIEN